ncbi:unnamed protein product [Ectocarpus sp. 6 AP-2014]
MLPRRLAGGCLRFGGIGARYTEQRLSSFRTDSLATERFFTQTTSVAAARSGHGDGYANHRRSYGMEGNSSVAAGGRNITSTAREELMMSATERAVAANLFFSFGTVGEDGEVTLQPHDLSRMLQSMGVVVSEDKLSQMVSRADKDATGCISEDDFLEAFDWLMSQGQDERDYMAIFNMLDKDQNGYVDVDELTNLHSTTKERLTVVEAKKILEVADTNGDGRMNYEEFLKLMTEHTILGWKLLTTFRVIFVMGGPASGKGTICAEVVKRANAVHVSSGDLLRDEVQRQTPLGLQQVAERMKEGRLVDASTVLALLEKLLTLHPGKHVLLDGFPRSLDNARDWARLFGPPEACIRINCPDEVMASRIVERGKGSGRADDHAGAAQVRIDTYHQQSSGPSRYFESIGLKCVDLDGTLSVRENTQYLLNLPMLSSICYRHVHEARSKPNAPPSEKPERSFDPAVRESGASQLGVGSPIPPTPTPPAAAAAPGPRM